MSGRRGEIMTLLMSIAFTPLLDAIADRLSRALGVRDASRTLGGTLLTRALAWCLAWYAAGRHRSR